MKIKRVLLDPDIRLRAPNSDVMESWEELQPKVKKMFKYHVDTKEGLKALADAIRQCKKDGIEKFGQEEKPYGEKKKLKDTK